MADEPDDIDLDQIVWDPRYRRSVIERLNRVAHEPLSTVSQEAPSAAPDARSRSR